MRNSVLLYLGLVLFSVSCSNQVAESPSAEDLAYLESIETWRKDRVNRLTSGSSWLALAGLFPLEVGENSFGSDIENKIRFPEKAAPKMGSFYLDGDSVMMTVRAEVDISMDTILVDMAKMNTDTSGYTPTFYYGSLNWNLIQRGDTYYVRLRDTLNDAIGEFTHIENFATDPKWNLEANFVPFVSPKTTTYQNVLGMALDLDIEGKLEFTFNNQTHSLEVLDGGPDDFFIIFEDDTTGKSTYGSGRYIYVSRPDTTNKTMIDFNKAYNPPCAFTEFATCLLPTPENKLALEINAGEKNYGDH